MQSQLTHEWRIEFENGFVIECYRERKPTRLANSWAKETTVDGRSYGAYTITERGAFNKRIVAIRPLSPVPQPL